MTKIGLPDEALIASRKVRRDQRQDNTVTTASPVQNIEPIHTTPISSVGINTAFLGPVPTLQMPPQSPLPTKVGEVILKGTAATAASAGIGGGVIGAGLVLEGIFVSLILPAQFANRSARIVSSHTKNLPDEELIRLRKEAKTLPTQGRNQQDQALAEITNPQITPSNFDSSNFVFGLDGDLGFLLKPGESSFPSKLPGSSPLVPLVLPDSPSSLEKFRERQITLSGETSRGAQENIAYFSDDYFAARSKFRRMVERAGGRLEVRPLDAKGPAGENLSIDIAWFGSENPRLVLLHSSGIHGVEGFAGSAIQLQLLDELPTIPNDAALILVHILNPYGMAWLRRVNENNVDLNRNFPAGEEYSGAPGTYAKLDSFLNPQSLPSTDLFRLKALLLILRYGMPALRQAVAGGQYEFPKGLFFGGKQVQQGPEQYETFLAQRLASVEEVVAIDVHTGLGKFGKDTLLVEPKDYDTLRRVFGERVTPLEPERSPAYQIQGDVQSMISRVFPNAKVSFVCQEFGTYNSTRVLHALREENRWHHYGEGVLDHPTKRNLKETFYPQDPSWLRSVLQQGKELVNKASEIVFSGSQLK